MRRFTAAFCREALFLAPWQWTVLPSEGSMGHSQHPGTQCRVLLPKAQDAPWPLTSCGVLSRSLCPPSLGLHLRKMGC